ncbi:MAG: hypothetical protein ABSH29_17655 [Acidimicrobiales bacterium]
MERDPSRTVQAARRRVHRVKRSAGRLLVAGLGFSVAYFLDAAQGRSRRKQVVDVFRRVRRSMLSADAAKADHPVPDVPRIGRADLGPRATFQRAADGIRASARV